MKNKTKIEIKREKYNKIRKELLETISQKLTLNKVSEYDNEKTIIFGIYDKWIKIIEKPKKVTIFINIDEDDKNNREIMEQIEKIIKNDGVWFMKMVKSDKTPLSEEDRQEIESIAREFGKKIIQKIDKIVDYELDDNPSFPPYKVYIGISTKELTYDEYIELKERIKLVDRKIKEIKLTNDL